MGAGRGGRVCGVRDRSLRMRLVAGVAALAVGASLASGKPDHARIAILGAGPEAASFRAYAGPFRSVGYPVRRVTPDELGDLNGSVLVVPQVEAVPLGAEACRAIAAFVEGGGRLVTAGSSPLSRALGIKFAEEQVEVSTIREARAPSLAIRWGTACAFRPCSLPGPGKTFAWTSRGRHAIVSSFRHGRGAVLFLGVELGEEGTAGYARFPYLLQAVGEAFGIGPPAAVRRLTAYADIGDHRGEDPLSLARAWYRRGIREVHVGAWDAFDANEGTFSGLIAACHRYGILVYAWLEPPEVSTAFWDAHPSWRERTATGADAHVDWRRLMALNVPECFTAVAHGWQTMVERFDWDGMDLAELYYESPSGLEAPQLFTPMNRLAREEFTRQAGFDPQELFVESASHFWRNDPRALQAFLEYRRAKIVELHGQLMALLVSARERKPHLDLVLTLVDALYDTSMRDRVAIDTARIAALAVRDSFALQVEDPYTLWALGPERYARIASDYKRLVGPDERLSVDINVVPRGENIVPTSQQTGLELYRLVSEALRAFPKVCVYSEGTIYRQDFGMLPSALASSATVEPHEGGGVVVESQDGVDLATDQRPPAVRLDGSPWSAVRPGAVLVPRGRHLVESDPGVPDGGGLRLREINAVLLGASEARDALTVCYVSAARAFLTVSFRPAWAEVDGRFATPAVEANEAGFVVAAPRGEHTIQLFRR
jgi:hypothetical protein